MAPAPPFSCPSAGLYLLAGGALDRLAYAGLLERLGWPVGVVSDFGAGSVIAAMRLRPGCAVVVADAPGSDAVDAIGMIRGLRAETAVLVISAAADPVHIEAWSGCRVESGPGGFLAKAADADELQRALQAVSTGRPYYSAGAQAALVRGAERRDGWRGLSSRERELLRLLAGGQTLREAARILGVRYKTADAYRSRLLHKLGMRNRVELTRYAIRRRIIDP